MLQANFNWQQYANNADLSEVLALRIKQEIDSAIDANGRAIIALSGGSTPKPLFERLAKLPINWAKVIITLVDERWVPMEDERSNAKLLYDHLLTNLDGRAAFVPLFAFSAAALTPESSCISIMNDYCRQSTSTLAEPAKFDVVILGMGSDGHTASFFPDADNVAELVDADATQALLCCHSPSSKVARVTWSVPFLLNARFLALHITGPQKKQVFDQAVQSDDAIELPIRAMLFQQQSPLQVFYAEA